MLILSKDEIFRSIMSELGLLDSIAQNDVIALDDVSRGALTKDFSRAFEYLRANVTEQEALAKHLIESFFSGSEIVDKREARSLLKRFVESEIFKEEIDLQDVVTQVSTFVPFAELNYLMKKSRCFDDQMIDIVHFSFEQAGFFGKVYVSEGSSEKFLIEILNGSVFCCEVKFCGKQRVVQKCATLVVDGAIEHVSELHNVLTHFSSTMQPTMIVARRFGDEVISTITLNNSKKKLDCLMVCLDETHGDVNGLIDIAVVCGCDVVSSLKGESVASKDPTQFPLIDSVSITPVSINVVNHRTASNVEQHIKHLNESINEKSISYSLDAISKRTKSLAARRTNIHVPRMLRHDSDVMFEQLNSLIKIYSAILSRGIIFLRDMHRCKQFSRAFVDSNDDEFMTVNDFIVAVKAVRALQYVKNSVGCGIIT